MRLQTPEQAGAGQAAADATGIFMPHRHPAWNEEPKGFRAAAINMLTNIDPDRLSALAEARGLPHTVAAAMEDVLAAARKIS